MSFLIFNEELIYNHYIFHLSFCIQTFFLHICVYPVFAGPNAARRLQIPWDQSYVCFLAVMWMLGIKSGSSGWQHIFYPQNHLSSFTYCVFHKAPCSIPLRSRGRDISPCFPLRSLTPRQTGVDTLASKTKHSEYCFYKHTSAEGRMEKWQFDLIYVLRTQRI